MSSSHCCNYLLANRLASLVGPTAIGLAVALTAGCASTGHVPQPFPTPGHSAPGAPVAGSLGAGLTGVVDAALALRGAPYRNGGTDPSGFDCSGFTQYVFARFNVTLPREARDQYRTGDPIRLRDIEPGDLLFFTTTAPGASHVAIAISRDAFVHAPTSTGVVRIEELGSAYWAARYLGARRIRLP